MSSHSKRWSGWQVALALGFVAGLGACSSDGGGLALGGGSGAGGSGGGSSGGGSGGGGSGGGGGAGSTGTLSRVVDGTTDLTGGLLSTSGNVVMSGGSALSNLGENLESNGVGGLPVGGNTLNSTIDTADTTLNGVAKVSLDNQPVVGSSSPSSSQLVGANVLSSNPQSGTLATATVSNAGQPLTGSGLIGVNASGVAVNPTGGTPLVGVNAAASQPAQGSLVTGTVLPQTAGTLGGGGVLGPVLPNVTNTTNNANPLGNLLPGQ